MAKVTRQDWLNAALQLLADEGAAALTLQRLLARLGVSHGSFYHHFANRQALTDAMLAYWEQHMTVDIVADSDRSRDTGHRVSGLIDQGNDFFSLQSPLENAIRSWAQANEHVRQVLERVDHQRRCHCRSLAASLVKDKQHAEHLGDLVHAVFIGSQQNMPAYSAQETDNVYKMLQTLISANGFNTLNDS
jgi:AcrR family transcriptional regulator